MCKNALHWQCNLLIQCNAIWHNAVQGNAMQHGPFFLGIIAAPTSYSCISALLVLANPPKKISDTHSLVLEKQNKGFSRLWCVLLVLKHMPTAKLPIITVIRTIYNLEVESRRFVSCLRGKVWNHNSVGFDVNLIWLQQASLERGK